MRRWAGFGRCVVLGVAVVVSLGLTGCEPEGEIINITAHGDNHSSMATPSADGRFVALSSVAEDLVPGDDGNGAEDVFLWDRTDGVMTRVTNGNGTSVAQDISDDGRFVVFVSWASDLVPGDTNGQHDVFRWDRATGTTVRVTDGNDGANAPNIARDGRYIVYSSAASNIVVGDTNGRTDVFLWDSVTDTTTRLSDGPHNSLEPTISGDGQRVTYRSFASPFVPGDTNNAWDIFVWDAGTGTTRRITNGDLDSLAADISADGRHVVIYSGADLVGDAAGPGLFVWDAATGATRRVTRHNGGPASISGDGRYVAFQQQGQVALDVAIWNADSGVTTLLTDGGGDSNVPTISTDGRVIAFSSEAFDLVPGDDNGADDIFVWTRTN